jgi:nucleoside-diphosphate-sugar epimerase
MDNSMNVLLTGGRGFIGKNLVNFFSKKHVRSHLNIDVLTRTETNNLSSKHRVGFIKGDLLDPSFDFDALVGKYDVIFNCAGELKNEALMHVLHIEATERLILACKKVAYARKKPIHWVQLSSVGAYGSSKPKSNAERFVTEQTLPAPVGTYEVTKTLADEIVMNAVDKYFTYTILRPSNVFGADMPNNSIRQLGNMVKKGLFFYIGRPGAVSNYVHVDDVAEALVLCGLDPRAKNDVFNLSNDCTQERVIESIARFYGVASPTIRLNENFVRLLVFLFSWIKGFPLKKTRVDALVSRTHYSNDKINHLLGFSPTRSVTETITDVLLKHKVKS